MPVKVVSGNRIPIKMWLSDIDEAALEQARHLAELPFAYKHIAIMPDSHVGFGMPIGGVLAAKNTVIPNAVGVDIGCGMCAVRTDLTEIPLPLLKAIVVKIRNRIPLGFHHHKQIQDEALMPVLPGGSKRTLVVEQEYRNAQYQVGTLGGGNHFIELQKGTDGFIWIMIHSGSRNLGKQVADYYNKKAVELNDRWHVKIPKQWQLAFLPVDSEEGADYWREMEYCVAFALANRKHMANMIIEECVRPILETEGFHFSTAPLINIAHNYAACETHYRESVIVHRKGATLANTDTIGIIPGSQGTKSYIVKGKGNPESFHSCSHGAGRKLGRNQAMQVLNLEKEVYKLEQQGILHAVHGVKCLDEAPGAYKDIAKVMENQRELVDIITELQPLAVVKG